MLSSNLVCVIGFEPMTPRSRNECSGQTELHTDICRHRTNHWLQGSEVRAHYEVGALLPTLPAGQPVRIYCLPTRQPAGALYRTRTGLVPLTGE